jgi:hypothetical protein
MWKAAAWLWTFPLYSPSAVRGSDRVGGLTAGYADQAHFTRDAVEFGGGPPRRILEHVGNVQDVVAGTM